MVCPARRHPPDGALPYPGPDPDRARRAGGDPVCLDAARTRGRRRNRRHVAGAAVSALIHVPAAALPALTVEGWFPKRSQWDLHDLVAADRVAARYGSERIRQ